MDTLRQTQKTVRKQINGMKKSELELKKTRIKRNSKNNNRKGLK